MKEMKRDQFLTEMMGECWHEWDGGCSYICDKCNKKYKHNPNFSTSNGFFKLWNFCKEQEWWMKFIYKKIFIGHEPDINPETFANAIAKFKGWKEGE